MAAATKQNSNFSEARIAEETSLGVVSGSAIWGLLEPNSYNDASGKYKKVARAPIGGDRQRKKGVLVDLDAMFGFNTDWTQFNVQDLWQGFFRADFRRKVEFTTPALTGANGASQYTVTAGGTALVLNDLVFARGFSKFLGNNGFRRVTASAATLITVTPATVVESAPTGSFLTRVGVRTVAGDLDVVVSGPYPVITSTTLNFTTLGLNVGEPVWIGGDAALNRFSNAANNGMVRIRAIAANALTLDKASLGPMVVEANTVQEVDLYFGRCLKNESTPSLIKRRTYQIERTLGAPEDTLPAQIQSEYFTKAVPNDAVISFKTADKIVADLGYMCGDHEQRTGATGLKAGTRPALESAPAQNTSSHLRRVRVAKYISGDETPAALVGIIDNFTLSISNGVEPIKGLTVLGSAEFSDGDFAVSGSLSGCFTDIAAVLAIRNNDDLTIDLFQTINNQGIAIDLPLVTFGEGGANVEKDKPIKVPVTFDAASGEDLDVALDHTCFISFFDYLPTIAAV